MARNQIGFFVKSNYILIINGLHFDHENIFLSTLADNPLNEQKIPMEMKPHNGPLFPLVQKLSGPIEPTIANSRVLFVPTSGQDA